MLPNLAGYESPAFDRFSMQSSAVILLHHATPERSSGGTRMAAEKVLALILGGGAGQRLFPLTKRRAKPAVPLGGKYRLIDIPVSNCINSGINRIFILTQYNSASLNRHIARTYRFSRFTNGFVEILAAGVS